MSYIIKFLYFNEMKSSGQKYNVLVFENTLNNSYNLIQEYMKVFALISGGKDSIFNIYKCMQNNHEIVALGNMYHENQQKKQQGIQLDSYMYQTVGTNITLGIAEALQKPLYRRKISGKPKITNLQYQGTLNQKEGDEVEDLYQLVLQAKQKHPEITAISSGAIFSTYQKLRVQNICGRLGLTSLAYLWQRDQVQLLQQMIDYPLNAIIIKVACYGLKVGHLGKTITELRQTFMKLKGECGMNVCGEGGEFQSLVLDCPIFKSRIVIDQKLIVQVDTNQIAPVAYLKIIKYHLQPK